MNQIEWKVKRSLYPVGVKASVFSVFAISIFQLAQLAPHFFVYKMLRNLSKFPKLRKGSHTRVLSYKQLS